MYFFYDCIDNGGDAVPVSAEVLRAKARKSRAAGER